MGNPIRRTIKTIGESKGPEVEDHSKAVPNAEIDPDYLTQEVAKYIGSISAQQQQGIINETVAQISQPISNAQIEHEIRVDIPRIESPVHCRSIITDLEAAFSQTPERSCWIVNMSQVDQPPLLLIGALERYQQELSSKGGILRLEVNSRNEYPDPILNRLASSFEIQYLDSASQAALEDELQGLDIDQIVQQIHSDDDEF